MSQKCDGAMGEKKASVHSRSYLSWGVYMLLIALAVYVMPRFWYLYVLIAAFLSYAFFRLKDEEILAVYDNGIIMYPSSNKEIRIKRENLLGFAYGKEQQSIEIEYRKEDQTSEVCHVVNANLIRIHSVLNEYYPEKNKVRNDYEKKVELNRQVNRHMWNSLKNKIKHLGKE